MSDLVDPTEILGSAMRRRGWIEGEPLSQGQIGAELGIFLGADHADASKSRPGDDLVDSQ